RRRRQHRVELAHRLVDRPRRAQPNGKVDDVAFLECLSRTALFLDGDAAGQDRDRLIPGVDPVERAGRALPYTGEAASVLRTGDDVAAGSGSALADLVAWNGPGVERNGERVVDSGLCGGRLHAKSTPSKCLDRQTTEVRPLPGRLGECRGC